MHGAFKQPARLLAGMRIEAALTGLAQEARRQRGCGLPVDVLAAILLDENAVDRRLAGLGWEILAGPAVAAETRGEEVLEQIGLVAVLAVVPRVAHEADALGRAFG